MGECRRYIDGVMQKRRYTGVTFLLHLPINMIPLYYQWSYAYFIQTQECGILGFNNN